MPKSQQSSPSSPSYSVPKRILGNLLYYTALWPAKKVGGALLRRYGPSIARKYGPSIARQYGTQIMQSMMQPDLPTQPLKQEEKITPPQQIDHKDIDNVGTASSSSTSTSTPTSTPTTVPPNPSISELLPEMQQMLASPEAQQQQKEELERFRQMTPTERENYVTQKVEQQSALLSITDPQQRQAMKQMVLQGFNQQLAESTAPSATAKSATAPSTPKTPLPQASPTEITFPGKLVSLNHLLKQFKLKFKTPVNQSAFNNLLKDGFTANTIDAFLETTNVSNANLSEVTEKILAEAKTIQIQIISRSFFGICLQHIVPILKPLLQKNEIALKFDEQGKPLIQAAVETACQEGFSQRTANGILQTISFLKNADSSKSTLQSALNYHHIYDRFFQSMEPLGDVFENHSIHLILDPETGAPSFDAQRALSNILNGDLDERTVVPFLKNYTAAPKTAKKLQELARDIQDAHATDLQTQIEKVNEELREISAEDFQAAKTRHAIDQSLALSKTISDQSLALVTFLNKLMDFRNSFDPISIAAVIQTDLQHLELIHLVPVPGWIWGHYSADSAQALQAFRKKIPSINTPEFYDLLYRLQRILIVLRPLSLTGDIAAFRRALEALVANNAKLLNAFKNADVTPIGQQAQQQIEVLSTHWPEKLDTLISETKYRETFLPLQDLFGALSQLENLSLSSLQKIIDHLQNPQTKPMLATLRDVLCSGEKALSHDQFNRLLREKVNLPVFYTALCEAIPKPSGGNDPIQIIRDAMQSGISCDEKLFSDSFQDDGEIVQALKKQEKNFVTSDWQDSIREHLLESGMAREKQTLNSLEIQVKQMFGSSFPMDIQDFNTELTELRNLFSVKQSSMKSLDQLDEIRAEIKFHKDILCALLELAPLVKQHSKFTTHERFEKTMSYLMRRCALVHEPLLKAQDIRQLVNNILQKKDLDPLPDPISANEPEKIDIKQTKKDLARFKMLLQNKEPILAPGQLAAYLRLRLQLTQELGKIVLKIDQTYHDFYFKKTPLPANEINALLDLRKDMLSTLNYDDLLHARKNEPQSEVRYLHLDSLSDSVMIGVSRPQIKLLEGKLIGQHVIYSDSSFSTSETMEVTYHVADKAQKPQDFVTISGGDDEEKIGALPKALALYMLNNPPNKRKIELEGPADVVLEAQHILLACGVLSENIIVSEENKVDSLPADCNYDEEKREIEAYLSHFHVKLTDLIYAAPSISQHHGLFSSSPKPAPHVHGEDTHSPRPISPLRGG